MFWDRLEKLCFKKKIKPNPLLTPLGISSSTISRWKKGGTVTDKDLILTANALDCSVDYLLGRTDNPQAHRDETILTDRERVLVAQYRGLNEQGREMLIGQASLLAGSSQYSIKSDEKPLTVASSDNK